jgi:hypothetical protein
MLLENAAVRSCRELPKQEGRKRLRQFNSTAAVTSTTFDPNPANNSATATSKLGK